MKDFRLVARIYNNQLRERREATGMTACAFAESIGVTATAYCELESLKRSPISSRKGREGTWTVYASRVAAALKVEPDVLWPEASRRIAATVTERRVNAEEIAALCAPEPRDALFLLETGEQRQAIEQALGSLSKRDQQVLRMRFGFDDGTEKPLSDIAERIGVSRERARQIELRALRALRHPARVSAIRIARYGDDA